MTTFKCIALVWPQVNKYMCTFCSLSMQRTNKAPVKYTCYTAHNVLDLEYFWCRIWLSWNLLASNTFLKQTSHNLADFRNPILLPQIVITLLTPPWNWLLLIIRLVIGWNLAILLSGVLWILPPHLMKLSLSQNKRSCLINGSCLAAFDFKCLNYWWKQVCWQL